jgi:hypothetical protein
MPKEDRCPSRGVINPVFFLSGWSDLAVIELAAIGEKFPIVPIGEKTE